MEISIKEMIASLARLQCKVVEEGGVLRVTPPAYRFDLNIEEDFIEEIARVHGYENVPAKPPHSSLPMMSIPECRRSRHAIRHVLADFGYQEVINYSFTPETWEADFAANSTPLKLANPISSQMSVMRSNLIGGLVASLQHNLNHGEGRLKIFEIGRCFFADEASVSVQPEMLAGLVYGQRFPEQWGEGGQKGAPADYHSVKGELEVLLHAHTPRFEKVAHPALHPGRSAEIRIDGKSIGILGELHPQWQQKYDLPLAPILFELDVEAAAFSTAPIYHPASRMQAVRRDVALLVNETTEIQAMLDAVLSRKPAHIIEFSPFDLYRGPGLENGKKSVAFRIVMQDTDRTLTDSEADSKVSEVVKVLYQDFGATLRK